MTGTQIFALAIIITILICLTALLITAIIVGNRTQSEHPAPEMPSWSSTPTSEKDWTRRHE